MQLLFTYFYASKSSLPFTVITARKMTFENLALSCCNDRRSAAIIYRPHARRLMRFRWHFLRATQYSRCRREVARVFSAAPVDIFLLACSLILRETMLR